MARKKAPEQEGMVPVGTNPPGRHEPVGDEKAVEASNTATFEAEKRDPDGTAAGEVGVAYSNALDFEQEEKKK